MMAETLESVSIAPERYELWTEVAAGLNIGLDRREFLKTLGFGILVLLRVAPVSAQEAGRGPARQPVPDNIGAWLHIGDDGQVTVYTGKVEVGQGIRTSLAQEVAEELRVPFESVRMVMGDTALTPFDMGTFGSRSTPDMGTRLRKVAAAARTVLIELAAARFGAAPTNLVVSEGKVKDTGSGKSVGFGELAKDERLARTVDDNVPLESADRWTVAGKPVHRVDGREIVTGHRKYTSDLTHPGMLHGAVVRPPAFGSELDTVDSKAAAALPGVQVVRDGSFLGVVAPTLDTATLAVSRVSATWKHTKQASSQDLFAYLKAHPVEGEGFGGSQQHLQGSVDPELAAAPVRLSQSYTVEYIAHTPLEPRAALAEWKDDRLTVWTGTQRPFGVRTELATTFGIPEDHVRVIMPDTGSGYGGKHTGEAAIEAARLARAAGKPVKLTWSRQEEFTWAYFRPAGVIDAAAGCKADGTLAAWRFVNYNSGSAGLQTPYVVEHQDVRFQPTASPLRQGSYRALAATANHFARETMMDELAVAAKVNPLEMRRKNLDNPRLRAVLDAGAQQFGWGGSPAPNEGHGLACGTEKGGFVATYAAVSVDPQTHRVRVRRLVTAFECGAIVNPENLYNQVEGAAIMGIGGALFEAIRFDDGRILNPHLSEYQVPRFQDTPAIEVVLVDRKDLPTAGAGESPIVCVAPAIGNAIFHATGTRLRSMPLVPGGRIQI